MARIRVQSPIGSVTRAGMSAPPLPADLTGRVVGFIDNNKANFDRLVGDMVVVLDDHPAQMCYLSGLYEVTNHSMFSTFDVEF